ncbi:hypothetical protein FRB96_001214 [Tulasnella sp. 330]|nr:hypothetical protein FRB96_001214 [Tulasnella sp. 330]
MLPIANRQWSRRIVTTRSLATLVNNVSNQTGPPTAVVLMNMGGPSTLPEVRSFLTNLFSDPDLIPLPMQSILAPWIAKRRTPQIEKQYADIGGGSPILRWTKQQGEGMEKILEELMGERFKSYVMFRYTNPVTADTLKQMKADGIKRAIAFTQYPQYSCSTTGSSLMELWRHRTSQKKEDDEAIEWSVIDRWGTHSGLVEAVSRNIEAALAKWAEHDRSKVVLLFSAHSLPMSVVGRGDPYVSEVAATVSRVMERLGNKNPYRLVWQSKVGPSAWMGPQTSDALKGLAKHGNKDAVLVPIAFTSDHIETLYELDLEYLKEAQEHGMNVHRAESLNGSPVFIRAMADIVAEHLKSIKSGASGPTSIQMGLRCPGCVLRSTQVFGSLRFASRRQLSRLARAPHKPVPPPPRTTSAQKWSRRAAVLGVLGVSSTIAYNTYDPFRHVVLAVDRISRCIIAVAIGAADYKRTFAEDYATMDARMEAYSGCHLRSAKRLLKALQTNGGIFIKLGQHISSVHLLPVEWTSTMRPLQDQCYPTPYEDMDEMFIADTGESIEERFLEFDPQPIGVASLAQVHIGRSRKTGKKVAVKLQHPYLEEFANIDMVTAMWCLYWVEVLFPEFEFNWLGEEMQQNLPLELDFRHEAGNAARARADFAHHRHTSLYIPEVYTATKRTMVMEFIEGRRVEDLEYLSKHHIDRNAVSRELSRIFSEMVYINGFFHADPHAGNLLIRPAPPGSRSSYNFEIALLDHGLYFDIDDELRVNYAHLWMSLIAPASAQTQADRRKYAGLVGNISPEMYPVFEAAITGRAAMNGSEFDADSPNTGSSWRRANSMLDALPQSEEELEAIRRAVMEKEGLIPMLFDIMRRMPRRVLMILKLNDLTRNLDNSLATTHPRSRIFLIVARYCSLAVWIDDRKRFFTEWRQTGVNWSSLGQYLSHWWMFHVYYDGLRFVEMGMDLQAWAIKSATWLRALFRHGLAGAERAAAGLQVEV